MPSAAPITSQPHQRPHVAAEAANAQPAGEPAKAHSPAAPPGFMGPFPKAPQVFTLHGKHVVQLTQLGKGNELHFALTPDTYLFINFNTLNADISRNANELLFTFEDGSRSSVTNYFSLPNNVLPPFILPDGAEIEGNSFIEAMYPLDFPIGP